MKIYFIFYLVSIVFADTGKGVLDGFDPAFTTFSYNCLKSSSYDSIFIGSKTKNDIEIIGDQYKAIVENGLNVELIVVINVESDVSQTERPQIIIDRINTRLTSFNITDPQHLWIDTSSLAVLKSDADWVQQFLSDFTDASANLQWTVGYITDRANWGAYTNNWELPASKQQLLWDSDSLSLDGAFSSYAGWQNNSVVLTDSVETICGTNNPNTMFDKTAFSMRVPVWYNTVESSSLSPISVGTTDISSLSSTSASNSSSSFAPPSTSPSRFSTDLSSSSPLSSTVSESVSTTQSIGSSPIVTTATTTTATPQSSLRTTRVIETTTTKSCTSFNIIFSSLICLIVLERFL